MTHSSTVRFFCIFIVSSLSLQYLLSQPWSGPPSTLSLFQSRKNVQSKTKHDAVVVAMFQNEASYLLEWLCYHLQLGISHFYLYDHVSKDDFRYVLQPFLNRGLVTLHDTMKDIDLDEDITREGSIVNASKTFHHLRIQLATLRHFHENYAAGADWALTIDIDEFLFLDANHTKIKEMLKMGNDNDAGGIMIERIPFSTNGTLHRLNRSQIAVTNYAERKKDGLLVKEMGKVFYKTRLQTGPISHLHSFHYSRGHLLNVKGNRYGNASESENYTKVHTPVALVHHLTRSFEECEEKRRQSRKYGGGWRHFVNADYCAKFHRGNEKYVAGMFTVDTRIRDGMEMRKRKLCETMWAAHPEYCEKWKCCGWMAFGGNSA